MNKIGLILSNPKKIIYCVTAILMLIGCVNVFSASYVLAQSEQHGSYFYLIRYIMWAAIGIGVMYAVRKIGYKSFLEPQNLLIIYGVVLAMLVLVPIVGISANGAKRWLGVGGFTFQPSEAVKVVVIMLATGYLASVIKAGRRVILFTKKSWPIHGMAFLLMILVAIQPDKGTAGIIAGLYLGVFVAAGLGGKRLFITGIIGLTAAGCLAHYSTYSRERLQVWLDPWSEPWGKGYQMVQAQLAIGSGGFWSNWGNGFAKYHYLPEPHTDYAFAVFCQENGFVGALFVIFFFLLMAYAFIKIAFKTRSEKGYLLVSGLMLYIAGQACANMAMVCGLLPVIGVPLPLISYGGTSMVTAMGAIGLVLSVYDETEKRIIEEKHLKDKQLLPEQRRQDLQFVERRRWTHRE